MQFIKDNDLYKVARITGPSHNFLAIRLSKTKCVTKVIELAIKPGEVKKLDNQKVLAEVLHGLDEINQQLGKEYYISEVQFIPSDTESSSTYSLLVAQLIQRIDSNDEFIQVSHNS